LILGGNLLGVRAKMIREWPALRAWLQKSTPLGPALKISVQLPVRFILILVMVCETDLLHRAQESTCSTCWIICMVGGSMSSNCYRRRGWHKFPMAFAAKSLDMGNWSGTFQCDVMVSLSGSYIQAYVSDVGCLLHTITKQHQQQAAFADTKWLPTSAVP
jgi:hypothetical protein